MGALVDPDWTVRAQSLNKFTVIFFGHLKVIVTAIGMVFSPTQFHLTCLFATHFKNLFGDFGSETFGIVDIHHHAKEHTVQLHRLWRPLIGFSLFFFFGIFGERFVAFC